MRVKRFCTDKATYDGQIASCETSGTCPLRGFCTESECMASLPGMVCSFNNS